MSVALVPRISLLDGFCVQLTEGACRRQVDDLPQSVQRLVAHVCLSGRPPRSIVAGQLWPDVPEQRAHASLRSALWRLQRVVPGLVHASAGALSLAEGVQVDVHELEDWARRIRDPACCGAGDELPEVVERGELLPGWYEEWVLLERERLRQLRMHAMEEAAGRLAASGRYGDALQVAYAAVRAQPLRESAHRAVIRVHLAEGNLTEALRAYEHLRVLLLEELGVRPSEHMGRLLAQFCPATGSAAGLPQCRGCPDELAAAP